MNNKKNNRKKRILYVENGIGYGGAIICLRHLVRNLDRSQFEPYMVTGRSGEDYRQIEGETAWKHIPDRYLEINQYKDILDKNTILRKIPGARRLVHQLMGRADDIINFLPFFLRFLKLVKNLKPDLIHVNNEPLCNRAAILSGKLMKIPVVCHVRGGQKGSAMMKWLYRMPDHFIPVSHWISKSIGNLGVPKSKRTVIYDGISFDNLNFNADGMPFRDKYKISRDDFTVGLIGMLIPWKGQRDFIDATNILKDKIPNLKMMIIGGTPDEFKSYEEELRKRVKDEKLEKTVIFTGHQTDMETVYNALDIAVSASSSPEPLGTMVIETMVMGRPLIAPAHGGGAEMTEHGKTGLLFKPGEGRDLADSILKFYNHPDLRYKYGKAAKEKALETFSVKTHVTHVQSVYGEILSK